MRFVKKYPRIGQYKICKKFAFLPYSGSVNHCAFTIWLESFYYIKRWGGENDKWEKSNYYGHKIENIFDMKYFIINIPKDIPITQLQAMLNGSESDRRLAEGILNNVE